jgi:hypothetical protein
MAVLEQPPMPADEAAVVEAECPSDEDAALKAETERRLRHLLEDLHDVDLLAGVER